MPTYSEKVIHNAWQQGVSVLPLGMKFETGTQVQHRDNPNWKAVVVRDLEPRRPVNGVVAVNHNGRVLGMSKTLLRMSFHADAKAEFGEVVS